MNLFHFDNGRKIRGPHEDMCGDPSKLCGDCTGIFGNVSELSGRVTGLFGDATGIRLGCHQISARMRRADPSLGYWARTLEQNGR